MNEDDAAAAELFEIFKLEAELFLKGCETPTTTGTPTQAAATPTQAVTGTQAATIASLTEKLTKKQQRKRQLQLQLMEDGESTTTTHKRARTEAGGGSSGKEPDHCIILRDFYVSGEDRQRVLFIINQFLADSDKKGKKFRRAHDTTMSAEPFVIPELPVNSNTGTQPQCVICQEYILSGVPRCKFCIVHTCGGADGGGGEGGGGRNRRGNVIDLCQTHVSHAICYAVLLKTLRLGYAMVCFGTCLTDRGGCRQPKKQLN